MLHCHVNSWFAIWIITLICMQLEKQAPSFQLQDGGRLFFFLCYIWCLQSHLLKLSCLRGSFWDGFRVPWWLFLPFHLFRQPVPPHQGLPERWRGNSDEQPGTGKNICQHWAEVKVKILTTSPFDPTLPWKPWKEIDCEHSNGMDI